MRLTYKIICLQYAILSQLQPRENTLYVEEYLSIFSAGPLDWHLSLLVPEEHSVEDTFTSISESGL